MRNIFMFCAILLLSSCASYQVSESPELNKNARWVILPINNQSTTPMAGQQAEQILSSVLFNRGVKADLYPSIDGSDLAVVLNDNARLKTAQAWLETQAYDYVITGTVQEWHYKTGLDGEPAVGVTLELLSADSGEIIWKSSGGRAGWGRESISSAGHKVIDNLVDSLAIN